VPIDQELGDVVDLALGAALEEVDLSDQGTLLGGFELLDGLTFRARGTSNVAADYELGGASWRPVSASRENRPTEKWS
jgi:hypothetical protein